MTEPGSTTEGSDFAVLLDTRYSCRAFLDIAVPEATVRDMFTLAQRTASWCNTQPWQVVVTSGAATRQLADALAEHTSAAPTPDLPMPETYRGVYLARRRAAGFGLYARLGIEQNDKPAREAHRLRNFQFFGAPHVAIITTDRDQGVYGAIDCGGYVANLLTAARMHGVDSIAQAAIAQYAPMLREHLAIPDDRAVVCAVSFGYADPDHRANSFRTERADLDDVVTFVRS